MLVKELLLEYKEAGALIIISCHDKEEMDYLADEVFCMADGKVTESYLIEGEQ